jgi:ATPase subunit of ABC transporter with duplicated ATPase domains
VIVDLHATAVPGYKHIATLSGVNHRFPGAPGNLWPAPLELMLRGPERVAIAGANGSGKSTLHGMLRGMVTPSQGAVALGTARVGYLDQQVSLLDDSRSVLENLRQRAPDAPEHALRILLGRFGLDGGAVHKPTHALSGGERMRAGLACLLCADQAPELLLLDEPTNNLDLASQAALASALRAYRGCLVLVSHDPAVLRDAGVDRVVDLRAASQP